MQQEDDSRLPYDWSLLIRWLDLPLEVTEEQLVALFSTIGEVEKDASVDENDTHPHYQITILKNEETQEAIGEAIVVYVCW